jgi:hypothetical protein
VRLLLESALRLHGQFGGHDCGSWSCRSHKSWGMLSLFRNPLVMLDFSSLEFVGHAFLDKQKQNFILEQKGVKSICRVT